MSNAGEGAAVAQGAAGVGNAYAQYGAGSYNAAIDRWNGRVARLQAAGATARGTSEVATHQAQTQRLLGAQRASFAGQGVLVDQGSAADVGASTVRSSAIDDQTIRANAALEAWGYQVQATGDAAKGRLASFEGNTAATGSLISASGRFADAYDKSKGKG